VGGEAVEGAGAGAGEVAGGVAAARALVPLTVLMAGYLRCKVRADALQRFSGGSLAALL
jgi:hypothetical protein